MMFLKTKWGIVAIFLSITILSLLYAYNLSNLRKIDRLSKDVSVLHKEREALIHSMAIMGELREKENQEVGKMRGQINSLRARDQQSSKEIDNAFKDGRAIDGPIPDDIARLLNEACESVRGSPCAPP